MEFPFSQQLHGTLVTGAYGTGCSLLLGRQGIEITNRTREMAQDVICLLVQIAGMRTNISPEPTCQVKVEAYKSSAWMAGIGGSG